ncbi:hypothetical protein [Endozoicomonas sp.]|uniref:hypothetical protein n=1 Tax=Endozoicomonas sp. TaxID=1892382 RepID=UPI003AF654B3
MQVTSQHVVPQAKFSQESSPENISAQTKGYKVSKASGDKLCQPIENNSSASNATVKSSSCNETKTLLSERKASNSKKGDIRSQEHNSQQRMKDTMGSQGAGKWHKYNGPNSGSPCAGCRPFQFHAYKGVR